MAEKQTADLAVTHTFDAPIEKVWQVWTDEKFVQRWWGVDGFSNILAKINVHEGGVSHVGMRASKEYGGKDYYNVFKYTRLVPLKLIQFVSNFSDKEGHVIIPEAAGCRLKRPWTKNSKSSLMIWAMEKQRSRLPNLAGSMEVS